MLDIKNTIPKMKQAFDGLISRLGMAEKSSELVDMSIQTHKMDKYRGKKKTEKFRIGWYIQELQDNYKSCNVLLMGIPKKDRQE